MFKRLLVFILCLLVFCSASWAKSPVWKVEKDNHVLYLGGTFHLLTPEDYPLPKGFETAFQAAQEVVFETNMKVLQTPEFMGKLHTAMMYPKGQTIQSVLSPAAYQKLTDYLIQQSLPISFFNQMKAGAIMMTLQIIAMKKMGFTADGVDKYLNEKATQTGKQVAYLETPEQQIGFIADLGKGIESKLINQSVDDLKSLPTTVTQLKKAWKTGNLNALSKLMFKDVNQYPQVYNTLLFQRNKNWLVQLKSMLASDKVEAVFVGAAHLAGPQGLIAQLTQQGYKVTQLP